MDVVVSSWFFKFGNVNNFQFYVYLLLFILVARVQPVCLNNVVFLSTK